MSDIVVLLQLKDGKETAKIILPRGAKVSILKSRILSDFLLKEELFTCSVSERECQDEDELDSLAAGWSELAVVLAPKVCEDFTQIAAVSRERGLPFTREFCAQLLQLVPEVLFLGFRTCRTKRTLSVSQQK